MKETMTYNLKHFQWREGLLLKVLAIIAKQEKSIKGCTVLTGDSLVEQIPEELLPDSWINNGIGGMCSGVLCTLVDELVNKFEPSRVIIHIGTNDMGDTVMDSPRDILLNLRDIVDMIVANNPSCKITLISTLPCIESEQAHWVTHGGIRSNGLIDILNRELVSFAMQYGHQYLNLNQYLRNQDQVKEEYYEDGLHLTSEGYHYLQKYLNQLL